MVRLQFMSSVRRYANGCVMKMIDSCIEYAATSGNNEEARPSAGLTAFRRTFREAKPGTRKAVA